MRHEIVMATARFWLVSVLALVLLGCQSLRPTPLVGMSKDGAITTVQSVMDRSVHGRVDFAGDRTTQATPADVVNAATVSFIDTGTNQTVATSKTDAAGSFSLALGGFPLNSGGTYLLEAVKGLNAQAPGSDAARFRTVLQWNGTGWLSCTNGSVPGSIVINALTTALAIETALDAANVPAANTIGKVDVSTNPATLNATPGPYTNHPDSEISQLASDLLSYLGMDTDPVASVPAIAPTISSFQPASAGANSLVRIVGSGFSPVPSGNTVMFNGASAQVLLATPTSLVVVVPSGATSGTLRVVTGRGSVSSGTSFTVGFSGFGGLELVGFSPTFGRADTVVTLSGSFGTGMATPTVTFPGASNMPAVARVSAWTASSMTVSVPIGAIPGAISVQSGASTATAPGRFDVWQGDLTLMTNITPSSASLPLAGSSYTLPYRLYDMAVVKRGSYAYVIGGCTGSYYTADIHMFPLNADTSLGAMRKAGTLLTGRSEHSAVVSGNFMYVFGGNSGLLSIERASFNADGTLGAFQLIGNLKRQRMGSRAIVYNGSVYVIGGYDSGSVDASSAERYTINPVTGDLTYVATYNLTVGSVAFPIRKSGVAMLGNKILLVGGGINSLDSSKVVTFPIDPNGTLADGSYGPDLGYRLRATSCAIVNDELYVMSGYDVTTTSYYNVVRRAPVDPVAGTVSGPFVAASPQLACSAWGESIANGNRLYSFGGLISQGGLALIQTAEIQSDKSLSAWASLGATRESYYGEVALVSGNRAWRVGGVDPVTSQYLRSSVYHPIGEDGTWGPPVTGPNLSVARYSATHFIRNGFLYMLGGSDGGSTLTSIERATIDPLTGAIGGFVPLSATLALPTRWAAVALVGDYVYVIGGMNEAYPGGFDAVQRARIESDGTLSSFEVLPLRLLDCRRAMQAQVIGNYLYVVGGLNTDDSASNQVLRATVHADGSLSPFTRSGDMPTAVHGAAVSRIGNYLYCLGGWRTSSSSNSQAAQRALIRPDGTLEPWETLAPGGRAVLPTGASHFTGPPLIYGNWLFLASGYLNGTNVLVGGLR